MNLISMILIIIFCGYFVFAVNGNEVLEFKSKIGFTTGEDKIVEYNFLKR